MLYYVTLKKRVVKKIADTYLYMCLALFIGGTESKLPLPYLHIIIQTQTNCQNTVKTIQHKTRQLFELGTDAMDLSTGPAITKNVLKVTALWTLMLMWTGSHMLEPVLVGI